MKNRKQSLGLMLAVWGVLSLTTGGLSAAEPVTPFLEGLRGRGLFDIANMYLEDLRSNPAIPAETKQLIPYEQGRTLVDSSKTQRDINTRLKELGQARAMFQEFITKNSQHVLLGSAQLQLGNVMVEEARAYLEKSKQPAANENPDELLAKSKDLFAQAIKTFDSAANEFDAKWKAFPKFIDPKETAQIEARNQAVTDFIQASIFAGVAVNESAKAYPPDSKEYKDTLKLAADRFHKVYVDWRKRFAGLYAGMLEARCLQDMGDIRRALGIYEELLVQPDEPAPFQNLKAKALRLALEAWMLPEQKKYEEVARRGDEWVKNARPDLERSAEGLGIRYFTALAYHEMKLRDENSADAAKKNEAKKYPAQVVRHISVVADHFGEFQKQAKEMLSQYRQIDQNALPKTFVEARDNGKQSLDLYQAKAQQLSAELAKGDKADKKLVTDLTQERDQALANAIKFFQYAIPLKDLDKETTLDDVNVVRYFLAFLYYTSAKYHEAAIMGEFLAKNYPKSAGARHGAKIALAAYLANYNNSSPSNREWDAAQMVRVAELITKTWKGEPEADEAWMTMGQIAIKEQNLTRAAEYLSNISPDSPRRADADLQAGQALWASYLTARGNEPKPPQEELDSLKNEAEKRLKAGVDAMRKRAELALAYDQLAAELSLAQIYVNDGRATEALAVLETKNGVKELLDKKDPITATRANFPTEAYKILLRAYVADQQMDNAQAAMGAFEESVKDNPNGQALLMAFYIQLGQAVEEQIKAEVDPEKIKKLTSAFGVFLDRIANSADGAKFNSLSWVAETLFRIGSGIDRPGQSSAEAKDYYQRAKKVYEKLLAMPAADKPAKADLGIKVRLSKCERRLGNYKEAVNQLIDILSQNNKLLEAQIEAAYTFQEWAEHQKDPKFYQFALMGWRDKAGVQVIWGWGQMATLVQSNPDLINTYHEARLNLAECRLKEAMSKTGAEKTKGLNQAKFDISIIHRFDPKMGGDESYAKYDRLLKTIQSALGEQARGLESLKQVTTQASASK